MGPQGYELTIEALRSVKTGGFPLFPEKPPAKGEKVYSVNILASAGDAELIINAFMKTGIYSRPDGVPSEEQFEKGLPALEVNWRNPPGILNFQDRNPDSL